MRYRERPKTFARGKGLVKMFLTKLFTAVLSGVSSHFAR